MIYVAYCVSFLLFCVFLFLLFSRGNINTISCGEGECLTNVITGEKICNVEMKDSGTYVCNLERTCNNPVTPYSYYDPYLGTIENGTCPSNIPVEECRCVSRRYCPDYITTFFESINVPTTGVPIDGRIGNTNYLVMKNISTNFIGTPIQTPPLSPGPNGVCVISPNALGRIWPQNLVDENRCIVGRLIFDEIANLFYCGIVPEMECNAPNRIIKNNEEFFCKVI